MREEWRICGKNILEDARKMPVEHATQRSGDRVHPAFSACNIRGASGKGAGPGEVLVEAFS